MSAINGIGLSGQTPTQRSEAAGKARLPAAAREDQGAVSTTVSQIAAQGAPVDLDRIAALRGAIKSGVYRLDPDAIAQKMISTDLGASTGAGL